MLNCFGVSINDSQPNCALQVVLYWFVRPAIYFSLIYGAKGIATGFASESLMETAWHFIGFIKKVNTTKIWISLGYDSAKLKHLLSASNRFPKSNFAIKSRFQNLIDVFK